VVHDGPKDTTYEARLGGKGPAARDGGGDRNSVATLALRRGQERLDNLGPGRQSLRIARRALG